MGRLLATLLLLAAVGTAAAGAPAAAPSALGVNWISGGVEVRRYDTSTLQPLGRPLRLQMAAWRWAYSPDRARVALAGGGASPTTALAVIGSRGLRRLGRTSIDGLRPQGVFWPHPSRLVLVGSTGTQTAVLAIDPATLRVVDRLTLEGRVIRGEGAGARLVLLLAPADGIGTARLVTVDSELATRTMTLDRIRAGQRTLDDAADPALRSTEMRTPGLAVSPADGVAYVVGDGEPVAIADLATSSVAYRELPERRTAAARKSLQGTTIAASWVAGGRLAITGMRYDGLDPTTRLVRRETLGLSILDLESWQLRTVDAEADWGFRHGRWLVTTGRGGLRWYDLAGGRRGELFAKLGAGIDVSALGDQLAVRLVDAQRTVRVDLRTGRVLGRLDYEYFPPLFLTAHASSILD